MDHSVTKDTDRTEALRLELVRAVVEGTGLSEQMAMPYANSILTYLQREHPGERLYVPAPARQYDVLQIQAALQRGASVAKVCRDYGVSRATLHRLFPGGLPVRADEAA
ncbi:hypothetical protein [Lysobacter olei]